MLTCSLTLFIPTLTLELGTNSMFKFITQAIKRSLRRSKIARFSTGYLILLLVIIIFAPYLAPSDPLALDLEHTVQPPSMEYPFGTDGMGRCILSRIIYGARLTSLAGFVAILVGMTVGIPLGLIAGYCRGKIDTVIMMGMETLMGFPYLLLVIVLITMLGPSLPNAMVAIGIWIMPYYTRLARASALSIKEQEFIEAARMSGESNFSIILRYIFPNSISPIIVWSTIYYARAILMAAGLGFLGLGAQPPTPEWGAMTAIGREYIFVAPHVLFFPSIIILLTALSFNIWGDLLRDILDPRLRGME